MPRIEFPSACAADVRGPQAADLCGAARALLGDCSPLKTTTHTHTPTKPIPPGTWLPITCQLLPFFSPRFYFLLFPTQGRGTCKVIYMFIMWRLFGKTGVQLTRSQLVAGMF